jgi:hypothetical protein
MKGFLIIKKNRRDQRERKGAACHLVVFDIQSNFMICDTILKKERGVSVLNKLEPLHKKLILLC